MSALITIRLLGSVVRSCDAKCYGAKHAQCDCVCGGANHAVGLEQAIANTRRNTRRWLDTARTNGIDFDDVEVGPEIVQEALFELEPPDGSAASNGR